MSVIDETKAAAPAEAEPSKKEVKMAADVPAEEKPATKVSYVTAQCQRSSRGSFFDIAVMFLTPPFAYSLPH